MELHAFRDELRIKVPVLAHHRVPVVLRDFAEEVELALEEHEPLRRKVIDDEIAQRVELTRLGDFARKDHLVVLAPLRELERPGAGAVWPAHRSGAHRHQPREEVAAALHAEDHGPIVCRLDGVDALEKPAVRRDEIGVAQTLDARDDVLCRAVQSAERVDEPVWADLGKFAVASRQLVWAREVVDLEKRLVEELDDARVVDRLRKRRVERRDALHRARESRREDK